MIRNPAVAGSFYPANKAELHTMVTQYLADAQTKSTTDTDTPKAIIAPHAGYIYSGPIAASAYSLIKKSKKIIQRVVLLGPSHRVAFRGLAATSAESFMTPLGPVAIDQDAIKAISALPQVNIMDEAHALEHSLEVHLPFLQETLEQFALVPLVVGDASPDEVSEVLETLWGGPETLIVISSDLSHYHDYDTAKHRDLVTSQAIEALQFQKIRGDDACGCRPVNGLLAIARKKGLSAHIVDLRNSGDTAGPRDQVVGYGAYSFTSNTG